jgi:hypothetical protein
MTPSNQRADSIPPASPMADAGLRKVLAAKIAAFPRRIRAEQIWSHAKLHLAFSIVTVTYFLVGLLLTYLVSRLLGLLGLTSRWLEYFTALAPWAFVVWALSMWWTRFIYRVLRTFFGVRRHLVWRRDQTPILSALKGGAMIGLHLRAFADEDRLYPTSRDEVPRALQSIADVFFVSVSNPQHDRFAGSLFVLEVPSGDWKATVFELMQIASIIVVDTNSGIFHWMGDLELADADNFRRMSAEFRRRLGFIDELREIHANGFINKTVAVVPPGWEDMQRSGEIEGQIEREALVAARCREMYAALRPEGDFPRTQLKRILLQVPNTVVAGDQIPSAVERVLGAGRQRLSH